MLRILSLVALAITAGTPAFAGLPATNVPEPASLALLAVGVGAVALYRARRK